MRGAWIIGVASLCALAACGNGKGGGLFDGREAFDGKLFRAKLEVTSEDKQSFTVRVNKPSLSLVGAREAGRHEAVSYCINRYGNSRADWTVGPDSDDADLVIQDDVLILTGRCQGW